MIVLYLILLGLAIVLLCADAFSGSHRGERFTVKLLPFALALVVLVWFIQTAKTY